MVTLLLEIVKNDSMNVGFYNPSSDTCRAYPRTESGIRKAISKFKKVINEIPGIEDFRIAAYEGKKEYWNERKFIGYIDRQTIINDF